MSIASTCYASALLKRLLALPLHESSASLDSSMLEMRLCDRSSRWSTHHATPPPKRPPPACLPSKDAPCCRRV
ncbi:hypothetical protein BD414DRAFT_163362 [Trametes punicea]|nr:hypothetical protein BD414DRAFT_503550 [Trametes punicea]KAI8976726.1 hypothetical protein BD414DRAFT_163362 [Trametes punicea]